MHPVETNERNDHGQHGQHGHDRTASGGGGRGSDREHDGRMHGYDEHGQREQQVEHEHEPIVQITPHDQERHDVQQEKDQIIMRHGETGHDDQRAMGAMAADGGVERGGGADPAPMAIAILAPMATPSPSKTPWWASSRSHRDNSKEAQGFWMIAAARSPYFTIISVFLAPLLVDIGAPDVAISYAAVAFGLISAPLSLVVGSYIDHTPYRRDMLALLSIVSALIAILVGILQFFAGWLVIIVALVFLGFAYEVSFVATYSYIPDIGITEARRYLKNGGGTLMKAEMLAPLVSASNARCLSASPCSVPPCTTPPPGIATRNGHVEVDGAAAFVHGQAMTAAMKEREATMVIGEEERDEEQGHEVEDEKKTGGGARELDDVMVTTTTATVVSPVRGAGMVVYGQPPVDKADSLATPMSPQTPVCSCLRRRKRDPERVKVDGKGVDPAILPFIQGPWKRCAGVLASPRDVEARAPTPSGSRGAAAVYTNGTISFSEDDSVFDDLRQHFAFHCSAKGIIGSNAGQLIVSGIVLAVTQVTTGSDRVESAWAHVIVGVYWLIGIIISLRRFGDRPAMQPGGAIASVDKLARRVGVVLREMKREYWYAYRVSLCMMILTSGLTSVFANVGIFLSEEVGFDTIDIGISLVAAQVMAILGAFAAIGLRTLFGGGKAVFLCCILWTVSLGLMPVWLDLGDRRITGFIIIAWLGVVVGITIAALRALFGNLIPRNRSSEFFGAFLFFSKILLFLGPLVYAVTGQVDSLTTAMAVMSVFFAAAGVAVWPVARLSRSELAEVCKVSGMDVPGSAAQPL